MKNVSIALLTALEAPLTLLIPVLAFWLAPLWGWIFVGWGLVAAVLDRRRLRGRRVVAGFLFP